MGLAENIAKVRENIASAAQRAGRKQEEISLVAVSKTVDADMGEAAYREGLRCFGENRCLLYTSRCV